LAFRVRAAKNEVNSWRPGPLCATPPGDHGPERRTDGQAPIPPNSATRKGEIRVSESRPEVPERRQRMTTRAEAPATVHPLELAEGRIDPDAEKVVRRLVRHDFEAYLVGGCVRDLLLGRSPKDFDVATSARPDDVRQLFRNSRIIGRRFRLVHVLFGGGKVIEVATFRRSPTADADPLDGNGNGAADVDLLIRSANAFGEAHEE